VWSNQFNALNAQLHELQTALTEASLRHENLLAQVQSQEDIQWIELTLMRELGMVPEGQRKVFFSK
jgi:hypothetical protein